MKKGKIFITAFLVFMVGFLFLPDNVFAVKKESDSKCLNKEIIDIDWKPDFKDLERGKFEVTFRAKAGKWRVYAATKGSFDDYFNKKDYIKSTGSEVISSGQEKKFEFGSINGYVLMYAVVEEKFEYKGHTCYPAKIKLDGSNIKFENGIKGKEGSGRIRYKKIEAQNVKNNLTQKQACKAMKNGNYYIKGNNGTKKCDEQCQARMNEYFPYCTTQETGMNFGSKTITKVRQAFIDYYTKIKEFSDAIQKYRLDRDEYKKLKVGSFAPKTDIGNLICNKNETKDESKQYYHEKSVYSNNYCDVKCVENLTVKYSPAFAAIHAGMCFTYKVTVKSKTECGIEAKGIAKNLGTDSLSKMGLDNRPDFPPCEGEASYGIKCENDDSAGPNEEFDACVKKCDGGKYGQKCIDKCYKKVYTSTTKEKTQDVKKMANLEKTAKVTLLSGNNKTEDDSNYGTYYYEENGKIKSFSLTDNCSSYEKFKNHVDKCVKGYMEAKANNPKGSYSKKSHTWKIEDVQLCPGEGYGVCSKKSPLNRKLTGADSVTHQIMRASPYYLLSYGKTKELIYSLFGRNKDGVLYNKAGRECTNCNNETKWYFIDNQGFQRQNGSNGWVCDEDCRSTKPVNKVVCENPSTKDAEKDLLKPLQINDGDLQECINQVKNKCTTEEVTFTIGADGDIELPDNSDNYSTNTNTPTPDNTTCKTGSGDDIFSYENGNFEYDDKNKNQCSVDGINGICYVQKGDDEYKTTITFRENYRNRKDSTAITKETCESDKTACIKDRRYCTKADAKSVNQAWVKWASTGKKGTAPEPDNYNIKANIGYGKKGDKKNGFGKFGWRIRISCFYGVYNGEDIEPGNERPTLTNYEIRAVDASNPFNESNNSTTSSDGSQKLQSKVAFNWTSDARIPDDFDSDLKKRGYTMDPGTYLTELKKASKNNKIYTDTNVDYDITLTPTYMDSISNKEIGIFDGSYHSMGAGKTDEVKRYTYYTSKLIKDEWRKQSVQGNRCNNSCNSPSWLGGKNE